MDVRRPRVHLAAALLGTLLTAVSAGVVAAPQARAEETLTMVALGDSSVAGPLVGNQNSWDCLRSDQNWARVAAAQLNAALTDVSCSGAVTSDLTSKRWGYIPAQIDAVTADTDVVTLAIGANDLNLGVKVPSCLNLLPDVGLAGCKSWLAPNGVDPTDGQLAALAPRIAAAVQAIHQKAPNAEVYLTGYLTYWQPGGCWPVDPVWAKDADYLQSIFDRLGTTLARIAAANGATYVDITNASREHGACATGSARWLEGAIPTSVAAPYHPNAAGMQAAGTLVADAIRD